MGEIDGLPLMANTHRDFAFDPYHQFVELIPFLVDRAREARDEAVSYRDFHVGAVLLAATGDLRFVGVIEAANTKPTPASDKVCAEKRLFGRARKKGYVEPVGLVVCGELNADHGSDLESPTLHPCLECREIIPDNTLIMSVRPDKDAFELKTGRELKVLHAAAARGEDIGEQHTFYDPGFKKWESNRVYYGRLTMNLEGQRFHMTRDARIEAARIAITGVLPGGI